MLSQFMKSAESVGTIGLSNRFEAVIMLSILKDSKKISHIFFTVWILIFDPPLRRGGSFEDLTHEISGI